MNAVLMLQVWKLDDHYIHADKEEKRGRVTSGDIYNDDTRFTGGQKLIVNHPACCRRFRACQGHDVRLGRQLMQLLP